MKKIFVAVKNAEASDIISYLLFTEWWEEMRFYCKKVDRAATDENLFVVYVIAHGLFDKRAAETYTLKKIKTGVEAGIMDLLVSGGSHDLLLMKTGRAAAWFGVASVDTMDRSFRFFSWTLERHQSMKTDGTISLSDLLMVMARNGYEVVPGLNGVGRRYRSYEQRDFNLAVLESDAATVLANLAGL